jgi:hypothetical protein
VDVKPLFYVNRRTIFQRPVDCGQGRVSLGFAVCDVRDGLDAEIVCAIMNNGEKPPDDAKRD